ncbi:MAG: NADH-quinone oxidoreductase subunit NuoE [Dehalococcoidia bacterium]|nr:NADH-quinone oxidoreductase subunit NuoE [Dehalococcoidia bacterium]
MANCELDKVESIVRNNGGKRERLISILHEIQNEYHYLPRHAVEAVAKNLGLPLVQVYGVATFFKAFSLEPRGEHMLNVCVGTACHVRGAQSVLDEVKRQLGIQHGQTTSDMQFSLETVNCLGACALGPVMTVDGNYHGKLGTGSVRSVLKKYRKASGGRVE